MNPSCLHALAVSYLTPRACKAQGPSGKARKPAGGRQSGRDSDRATAVSLHGAAVHVAYGRIRSYDSMTAAWHNPSKVAESAIKLYYHAHLESATGSLGTTQT